MTLLENAAADEAHTPFLYAKFLRSLIASKVAGDRTAIGTRVGSRAGSPVAAEPLPDLTASLQEILDANANEDMSTSLDFDTAVLDDSFWSNVSPDGSLAPRSPADSSSCEDAHAYVTPYHLDQDCF